MGSSSVENFGSPSLCFDFSAPDAPCHLAKITGTSKEKRADKQIHCPRILCIFSFTMLPNRFLWQRPFRSFFSFRVVTLTLAQDLHFPHRRPFFLFSLSWGYVTS